MFGGGATHRTVLRWANLSEINYESYQNFMEPYLLNSFTLDNFKEARQPDVGMVLEDFTINPYFKKCKYGIPVKKFKMR